MPLNPQVQGFLQSLAAAGAPAFHTLQPAQCRQAMAELPTAKACRCMSAPTPVTGGRP